METKKRLKRVEIAYTDTCLPDYFGGDSRPWVTIQPTASGYTSKELRQAILSEFSQGAYGGSDPVLCDFIQDKTEQDNAEIFYSKLLKACLNRDIHFRGKAHKLRDFPDLDKDCEHVPLLHVVFNLIRV